MLIRIGPKGDIPEFAYRIVFTCKDHETDVPDAVDRLTLEEYKNRISVARDVSTR